MNLKYINRAAWLFLAAPYLIFVVGWLRPLITFPFVIIFTALFLNVLRGQEDGKGIERRDGILAFCVISLVLFFSGIGGYTFQNWDFHGRNAVFHDLVNYPWPVVYQKSTLTGGILIMSYYMAYWLPSAVIGKLFGWQAANFTLFLWTAIGVFLIVALLSVRLQTTVLKTTLLFFVFSGMDILGVGVNRILNRSLYPALWPPLQHLEWWSLPVEISSMTTQVYWVFNQSVPALLAMSLWLIGLRKQYVIFLWALTFFFSPLPSIGLMIFLGMGLVLRESPQTRGERCIGVLRQSLSLENVMGLIVFLIGYTYFSTNLAAQDRSLQYWDPVLHLIFFLLEGGILWIALLKKREGDPFWLIAGLMLFLVVFIRIGKYQDFVMRATIPALLYLMIGVGEELFHSQGRLKKLILICLAIGAVTPLYEINRSFARTLNYYFDTNIPVASSLLLSNPGYIFPVPELDHPGSITADSYKTLNTDDESFSWRANFLGNYGDNFFTEWLMK